MLTGVARRLDLALDPADPEAAGDQDPVAGLEFLLRLLAGEPLGVDPADLDLAAQVHPGVVERLDHREVGVGQLGVLAHEPDPDRRGGLVVPLDEPAPVGELGRPGADAEVVEDLLVHPSSWKKSGTL